jgi:hypothetical protein
MTTLTVQDAARRLGIKPAKVRTLIGARKLSAYPAPPGPGQRGDNHMLLDADEVEALARMRAHRRHLRTGTPVQAEEAPEASPQPQPQDDDILQPETLSGDVESITIGVFDHTGQRIAVLVQSMLAPLVTELHDARETIRRQAEELGALRTTVADLERRVQQVAPAASTPPNGSHGNGSRDHEVGESVVGSLPGVRVPRSHPANVATSSPLQTWPQRHKLPLWQRAVTHLLTR